MTVVPLADSPSEVLSPNKYAKSISILAVAIFWMASVAYLRIWRSGSNPPTVTSTWANHRYELYPFKGFERWVKLANPTGGPDSFCIAGDELAAQGWVKKRFGLGYVWWKALGGS